MTDFMMPEMNGREVCEAVRALRPQCPIIVASAYRTAGLDAEDLAPLRLLDKPIDPPQLSRTVHNLLIASAAG
jgi:CheY-like chemotaxis protein